MFNFIIKRGKSEVAGRASKHWTDNLTSPYISVYKDNVRYKFASKPILSKQQAIVFKKSLEVNITQALKQNGYLKIAQDGPYIEEALKEVGVVIPKDRMTGDVMFIEEDSNLFIYSPGMSRAKKL